MSKKNKIITRILAGTRDANISFDDLCYALETLGFEVRIKGSHHIFTRDGVKEIINIQAKGSLAKPYQVKQVRELVSKNKLWEPNEE